MRAHIFTALVSHKPGVLQRVSSLFSRRKYNIESITVGPTDNPDIARMTILVRGDQHILEQVEKQMNKLPDIIKVSDLRQEEAVCRELCLIKVNTPNQEARSQIIQYANVFRANIVDVKPKTLTVEVTGDSDKIEAFINLTKSAGIKEIARTGMTALQRG